MGAVVTPQTGGNGARVTVKVNLNQEQKSLFDGKLKRHLLLRFLYDFSSSKPADLHRHQRRERAHRRVVVRRETDRADVFTSGRMMRIHKHAIDTFSQIKTQFLVHLHDSFPSGTTPLCSLVKAYASVL